MVETSLISSAGSKRQVSIIIPVYNQVALLDRCLASLSLQQGVSLEVIVVDDSSPEDPASAVKKYPQTIFIRSPENVGYAEANNLGLRRASGEYLMFLNSDTELPPDAVRELVSYLESHPEIGGVTPLQRGLDGLPQNSCHSFPNLKNGLFCYSVFQRLSRQPAKAAAGDPASETTPLEREVQHAITSCLLIRRQIYDTIGGMDPWLRMYYNDADYCFRMRRQGFRIRFWPGVEILHHYGASVRTTAEVDAGMLSDRFRYYRKWYGWRGIAILHLALASGFAFDALQAIGRGKPRAAGQALRKWGSLVSRVTHKVPA